MISERNLFWACAAMLVVFFMTYSSRQQAQLDTIKAQLVSKNQLISPHPEARDLVIPTSGLPALTCPSCGAASPPASQRAWMNEAARSLYISNHRNQVLGAMQDVAGLSAALVAKAQKDAGVTGSVGEIGVHHGLFFFALAMTAARSEVLFALDVFERQDLNVDKSGLGDYGTFIQHAASFGIGEADMKIVKDSSLVMTPPKLCAMLPKFRMLSIDGGHFAHIVYSDLKLASCHLADGGVLFMDDFTHPYWPGVQDGIGRFFHLHPSTQLAPFLVVGNKLLITTKSHHDRYLEFITKQEFWWNACEGSDPPVCIEADNVNGGNAMKFQLYGSQIAVADYHTFKQPLLNGLWTQTLNDLFS